MATQQKNIRVCLKSFEHKMLDGAVIEIIKTAKRTRAKIRGPIPLPTRIRKFTLIRSPHVHKKSRDQLEIRTHKRLLDIIDPTPDTMDKLQNLDLPHGVDVEIKM